MSFFYDNPLWSAIKWGDLTNPTSGRIRHTGAQKKVWKFDDAPVQPHRGPLKLPPAQEDFGLLYPVKSKRSANYRDYYDRSGYTARRRRANVRRPAARKRMVKSYRSGNRRILATVPRGIPLGPVPNHMVVRLQAVVENYLTINNADPSYCRFKANSLNDIVVEQDSARAGGAAGAGTQGYYGLNELKTFYDKYKITGSSVSIQMYALKEASDATEVPITGTLMALDSAETGPLDDETALESGLYVQQRIIQSEAGAGNRIGFWKMSKSTKQVLGPHGKGDITGLLSPIADPDDNWVWYFYIHPAFETSANGTGSTDFKVYYKIRIVSTVHFFDRKQLSQTTT